MSLNNILSKPASMEKSDISLERISDKNTSRSTAASLARKILIDVMRFRRISGRKKSCSTSVCEACMAPHISKMILSIEENRPIIFVLPAFPGKSPNLTKVLGILPDMAEQCSLEFLQHLCERVRRVYEQGARIILCSDGRVFNDVVGMRDEDVTDYQCSLLQLMREKSLTSISTFNLDDLYSGQHFNEMREQLMRRYSESLEDLKAAIGRGGSKHCSLEDQEINRLYCGITRFLVEDATYPGQLLSRNALQSSCRQRAYVVVQRSRAWSELIAEVFPDAVRLSIHPQTCGTSKLGIRLMEAESWMTPWHGVAVDVAGRFVLLKRAQAEQLGARLVHCNDKPSHYELNEPQRFFDVHGVLNGK